LEIALAFFRPPSSVPRPPSSGRRWLNGFLATLGFTLVPLLFAFWIVSYGLVPGPGHDAALAGEAEVWIPPRTGLAGIAAILASSGVIEADVRFLLLARLTGRAGQLRAGEYRLPYGQSPWQVLKTLSAGRVIYRQITIPEGMELRGVADLLAAEGWVGRERFLALTRDRELLQKFDIPADTLEGYLFPDTYALSRGQQQEGDLLRQMVGRALAVFEEVRTATASSTTLSRHQVLTLASIVEKETGRPEERPLIARVFLNRLERGMRLQADPTAVYGRPDFQGPVTGRDLRVPSPYNTYLIDGLPPGPIANPGRAAIEAVLRPAEHDYLYFVATADAAHHFSRTLEEHNRAVARLRAEKATSRP